MSPEEIKALRELLGLSMEAFGERVGVGKSQVSRWESGDSHPTYKKMAVLNDLLGSLASQARRDATEGQPA